MGTTQEARPLTNDEKKAAEAAFRGAPFNPKWSEAARKVYQGISGALVAKPSEILGGLAMETQSVSSRSTVIENKTRTRSKSKIQ